MHGEARARSGWSWPRHLQMYALCTSALMFGFIAVGCQTGSGVSTPLAKLELRVDPASTYRPALRLAGLLPPGDAPAEGRHQAAVIAPEPVNVRVDISGSDFGILSQTVAVGATSLEFLVPQGLNRQIVLVFLDATGAILGTGSALVNVGAAALVVNVTVVPGVPGIAIGITDTFQAANALQNQPFPLNSGLINNTNGSLTVQVAGHRFRTEGSLVDTSGAFAESGSVPAAPFTLNAGSTVSYSTLTNASTSAPPGRYQIDGVVQGTSSVSGAFGVRTSVVSAILRLIREHTLSLIEGDGTPAFQERNGSTPSRWNQPIGIARLGSGDLIVSDRGNNRLRVITTNAGGVPITTTVAGTGIGAPQGDNAQATNTNIAGPQGIAVASGDVVVFAESGNNKIRDFRIGGLMKTTAGNGTGGFAGDGLIATDPTVQLRGPEDVLAIPSAAGGQDTLLIADTLNHAVRRIDGTTGIINTIAGQGTLFGDSGDGGAATSARLFFPRALAFDLSGNLLIAHDYDDGSFQPRGLIRRVDRTTGIITTVAGSRSTTPLGGGFDAEGRAATDTRLGRISGIAADPASGFIYFTEEGNAPNSGRVIVIDTEGNLRTVAGGPTNNFNVGAGATRFSLARPARLLLSGGVFVFPTTDGNTILGLQ